VEPDDGYRLAEPVGARAAVFCRLEHVVPWSIRGPAWQPASIDQPLDAPEPAGSCARCGDALDDTRLLLVRHRGPHRIPDAFCSLEHVVDWAKAGGRWG
jgi:hypothetical protein